ncbi:MurR/RpiR family transcriptional regulator [Halobacillus sp. A5]|uniref:MurR/RpiR family transcriptional regulator n=1 Tax=Halobacillus sp. A5 TaxID=2880263 RepID=UPI0020A67B6C|nr:MurR/RpiR family transcriptional regulator [Halobacillus sp. A5]MCP3027649.1 MurR/RpiR family transcriptional regulator [Halobacillus sp. A5]
MKRLVEIDDKQLTRKQQQIADVIKKRGTAIAYMTEQEVAEQARVSIATVSRFWMMIGYKNFKAYKNEIKKKIEITPENKMKNFVDQVDDGDLFSQLIEQHFKNLVLTNNHFDKREFNEALNTIAEASTLFIHAPASSEGLGDLLEFRLKRFGIHTERMAKSGHEIYESLLHLNAASAIIIFQFVDLLPETKVILDYAQECSARTILITDRLVSEMGDSADYTLYAHRGEMWEFHTMVSPVALLEALVMGIGMTMKEESLEKLRKLNEVRKKYKHIVPK